MSDVARLAVQARYDRMAEAELSSQGVFEPLSRAKTYFRARKLTSALALGSFPPGGRILEVGCSVGQFSFHLARLGYRVVGVDVSSRSVELATRRAAAEGLVNAVFAASKAEELREFQKHEFDGVISFSTLRYVPDLPKALSEIHRVLKPGTTAVIDFPNRWCPWFYLKPWLGSERHPHDHWFTAATVKRLFRQAGFVEVRVRYLLFTPTVAPDALLGLFQGVDWIGERLPVLLTCDIHTHMTGSEPVKKDLVETRRILQALGLRCTFFFPAHSAELLRDHVEGLLEEGHEIGCHGLTHDPSENYSRLPLAAQRTSLTEATTRLTRILGAPPISFRAPVFKISGETIRVLDELGYRTDLSVTAQRLGVFGSDIYDVKPLFAPRRPYHPDLQNPFRRGAARTWEVPVSAWLLPFLSNTERLCGLPFMRWFFRALYVEAKRTGKPIVFMFHAEDFNGSRGLEERWRLSWKDFLPTKTFGFQFRHALMERDWQRVQRDLVGLFRFMAGFPDVQFVTAKEYLPILEGAPSAQPAAVPYPASVRGAAATSAPSRAGLTQKDILCLSSIDWDFIWQGHQQIMATLAEQGNRVLFVENTGVRAPTLRDLPRLTHRIMRWMRSTKG
ncbi:MAG: methyltransferase domain-containing protein, partial [Candidatus Omnitrophica bacterium]|nr:methyltransferase domain-containing protein [Candidatus Omnitrophota bacterium]